MALRYPAERIVVKAPNWVGDLVAATGAFRCLRRNYEKAFLALVVKPSLVPIIDNAPWFDKIILWDRHESPPSASRDARRALREAAFDLAVLFTHSFSSRWLMYRHGIPRRVGLARNARARLLTDRVDISRIRGDRRYVGKVELYRALCRHLGCRNAEDQRPEIHVGDLHRARAEALLRRAGAAPGRPLLGLVPGAAYGASKRWPPDRFGAVADRFVREHGFDAAIFISPDEERIADAVAGAMQTRPVRFPAGAVDLAVLKALVENCSLLIANDTGPRHYAIALGVPVVTLMGPTDPAVTESPYENGTVLRQDVPCGPCYKRECPLDHECMKRITVEDVYEAGVALCKEIRSPSRQTRGRGDTGTGGSLS